MIRSRDCEDGYHHLCDGWYGHQAAECGCECHTAEPDVSEEVERG